MSLIQTIGGRIAAHGVEVVDLRQRLSRGADAYPAIRPDAYRYTAVHYTAVDRAAGQLDDDVLSWQGHARYHVTKHGWPGIAYTIGVSLSGRVFLLHEVEQMGYHAFAANAVAFPVCVDVGAQAPTAAALAGLVTVLRVLHEETPELPWLTREGTWGHRELTFLDERNVTICPGPLLPAVQQYRAGGGSGAPPAAATRVTFPTGISLDTRFGFYRYWVANGGIAVFGYPISEELTEDGQTVQYFERARLELASGGNIYRGLVGRDAYEARYGT